MSDLVNEWLSVEAAALRLGISSRSIARRIQSAQLESRVDENGRRSVLVTAPAPAATQAVQSSPETSTDAPIEAGQARELAQQALSVVIRTHEESVLTARAEILSARRSAVRGWVAAAILLVGSTVTVGIVTHNLTAASAIVHQAEERVDHANQLVGDLTIERNRLRQELVDAKVQQADSQGRLAVMTTKVPTTAPSNTMQRVATALFGE